MKFAKRQIFFISILLSLCMFFAPFAHELYAESVLSKLKTGISNLWENTVEKYTSRDYWVDKAASAISTKLIAKPVKLATAALGIAVGTAVGGPVGATLGAYVGSKVGTHLCSVFGTQIVKGVINEKLDNGGKITVSSIFNICKNLDTPSLACDTTGAIVGDILGSAVGGVLGAAITACVGGGTILPIIGTITFATLGAKYGKKLGTWLGKKIGEKFFNKSYKALTGIDRTLDQSADSSILLSTAKDIASINKEEVARATTSEVVGDVIGSVIGTVAGATLSAVTTGGTSETITEFGEKLGSKAGTAIGKLIGEVFFDSSKKVISDVKDKKNSSTSVTVSPTSLSTSISSSSSSEIPVSSLSASSPVNSSVSNSAAAAVYEAYKIAYDNYAKALADPSATPEYRQQRQNEYNNCYEMYRKVVIGK